MMKRCEREREQVKSGGRKWQELQASRESDNISPKVNHVYYHYGRYKFQLRERRMGGNCELFVLFICSVIA